MSSGCIRLNERERLQSRLACSRSDWLRERRASPLRTLKPEKGTFPIIARFRSFQRTECRNGRTERLDYRLRILSLRNSRSH